MGSGWSGARAEERKFVPVRRRALFVEPPLEPARRTQFVPVRRREPFVEPAPELGPQWALFEPNGEPLWALARGPPRTAAVGRAGLGRSDRGEPRRMFAR